MNSAGWGEASRVFGSPPHRRITIWHQSGVPARELAERDGHARPSMSLDIYSHVTPADEVAKERILALIDG